MTSNHQANVAVDGALSDTTPGPVPGHDTRDNLVEPTMELPPNPSKYVTMEAFTDGMQSVGKMFEELKELIPKGMERPAMQVPAPGFAQIDPATPPFLASHIFDAVRDLPS